jgi:hypothetical protein
MDGYTSPLVFIRLSICKGMSVGMRLLSLLYQREEHCSVLGVRSISFVFDISLNKKNRVN